MQLPSEGWSHLEKREGPTTEVRKWAHVHSCKVMSNLQKQDKHSFVLCASIVAFNWFKYLTTTITLNNAHLWCLCPQHWLSFSATLLPAHSSQQSRPEREGSLHLRWRPEARGDLVKRVGRGGTVSSHTLVSRKYENGNGFLTHASHPDEQQPSMHATVKFYAPKTKAFLAAQRSSTNTAT